MPDTFLIQAPFTLEQVELLNAYQRAAVMHPFTCGRRDLSEHPVDPEGDNGVLVATEEGWICRHCDYTQDWAHEFMFNPAMHRHPWERIVELAEDAR